MINDSNRLRALHGTALPDSPPEPVYDRITRAAADVLDAPYAAIYLVDVNRQFLESAAGQAGRGEEGSQTSLERSVCQYTVANGLSAVLDGTLVAYLGIPLIDPGRQRYRHAACL